MNTIMISLYNPYALRMCFRIYSDMLNPPLIFPFYGCIYGSHIEIRKNMVVFVVNKGLKRYQVCINYRGREVVGICAFCYAYCRYEHCWIQMVDDDDYKFFDITHSHIVDQVRNHFFKIDSRWNKDDRDSIECPWLFSRMKAFEQLCTPRTNKYITNYIKRLNTSRYWRLYAQRYMLKRSFSKWKEWYFDPSNEKGFICHLQKHTQEFEKK